MTLVRDRVLAFARGQLAEQPLRASRYHDAAMEARMQAEMNATYAHGLRGALALCVELLEQEEA